jgi:hypothetical protein
MAAPVNTILPEITGTPEVGQELSVSTGTWTGGVQSYAYQWQRINSNVDNIEGATNTTYVLASCDVGYQIQCKVTATNNNGSTSVTSLPTTTILGDWFIVEDGSGKSDAVSLCSMLDANSYHAKRGNSEWSNFSQGCRKSLLVRATDYLEQAYRLRWKGTRVTATQSLSWPRIYVEREDYYVTLGSPPQNIDGSFYYPSDEIPLEVIQSVAELALKARDSLLNEDLTQGIVREKVDVLEVQYDTASPQQVRYRSVDMRLRPFLKANGNKIDRV